MKFDPVILEIIGLAAAIYALVWLAGRLLFRRLADPPLLSLHLAAISLGIWLGGLAFHRHQSWIGHAGALLIFSSVILAWSLFDRLINVGYRQRRKKVELPIILRQLGGLITALITLAIILKWGYRLQLTGLLATSGIAAVILGFAMQDLLANVIAGISIHMTRAYQVGDWLLLGSSGERAKVREINWRSTRLITNDHISHEVPNSEMVKSQITNLNHPTREHGVRMCVGLDYDTPPAMAKEVLLTAANNAQGVLTSPPPVVFLKEFADSSIIYELRFWMESARLYNITCDEINTNLWYELGRRNIRIPFPIRSIEKRQPNLPASLVSAKAKAAEILRSDAALSCLTEPEASDLLRRGSFLLFGPKEDLVKLGQPGDSMYLILEGRVEVLGKCVDSSPILLAQLKPGECFGELSLMTGEPRAATVRAISDVLVLEIRKADLSPLIAQNPELAERLGSLLEQRRKAGAETLQHAQYHAHLTTKSSPETRSLATRIRNFFASSPQP